MAISRRQALLTGAALSVSLTAGACGSSDEGTPGAEPLSDADLRAALKKGGSITVWSWDEPMKPVVADFMTKYPEVKVDLVNAGTNTDAYTALQNAIKAGKGVPDIAMIEYYALPQFALAKSLVDLRELGADKLKSAFTPGPWNAVRAGTDGVYGLPMDSGPMALFYNKEVFDQHGIKVPKTWEEYFAAAEKLHAADPKAYITNDTGDAGFTTSMIWQAGGKPYSVDGTRVGVDFADAGSKKFAESWQRLIDDKLLASVTSWSDEWYKGLGDGSIATLVIGAWMPASLQSGVKAAAGKWRVAPMPQWESGAGKSAENGGSSLVLTQAGAKKTLAYAFLKYATVGAGVQTRIDEGTFPATTEHLDSPVFRDKKVAYFGGQRINQVLAESAQQVVPGWSYLPYQVYANSVFNDTVGKAYVGGASLRQGLKSWQDASVEYGKEQGFTVQ
ncbi:ABC transporter substrate-binding protein [Streptomyces sp. KL118A]|uniref:ABC transporter substrate-binding protein n=1 Tax=Streptomyces sp. KL118A TaxID=3045153 RepID=UPI00278C7C5B|nr:sugar ABC transporter substrate-binding protein [Streptomyces sp. KL118A]